MATQISSRVQQTFSVKLPLRELFAAPTLANLATTQVFGIRPHDLEA